MNTKHGILLAIFGLLVFCTFIGTVSAATIYVPDDYAKIQWAVDNASVGDTIIVRDGTYIENVDVNKRLTIKSENGADSTIVNALDPNDHVFEVTADHVNIIGFTVQNASDYGNAGIYLYNLGYCTISDNTASNNAEGIFITSSSDCTLTNNIASNNDWHGIGLFSSSDCTLTNNIASNNGGRGIGLFNSSDCTLTNNIASNNHAGIILRLSSNCTLDSNTASDNKEGIFITDSSNNNSIRNNRAISNGWGGIRLGDGGDPKRNVTGNSVIGNNASYNGDDGIGLEWSAGNTVIGNIVRSNHAEGISLFHSNLSILGDNTAINNNESGIGLFDSHGNTINSNTVTSNGNGVLLSSASNNIVTNNDISNNNNGICLLESSDHNTVLNNIANSNTWSGIWIFGSLYNNITENTANLNNGTGITLEAISKHNIISKNTANSNNHNGILVRANSGHESATHPWGPSDYNTISGNTADSNNHSGIFLWEGSSSNTLLGNNVNSNSFGIRLSTSCNNTLKNNVMNNNRYNFGFFRQLLFNDISHFYHDIDTSNMVDGKPIYYWIEQENQQVPDDAGFVGIVNSTNITVRDLRLTNNSQGVVVAFSNDSRIEDVYVSNNFRGIVLYSSCNNTLTGINASSNYWGIRLGNSNSNLIYNNYFENTFNAGDDGNNIWNVSKTAGTNIIGGSWLGGNYWSDYAGEDTNGDGLGDTLLPYNSGGEITTGGDWHPLVQAGIASPEITSFAPPSPVSDTICTWRTFNVTVNQTVNVSWDLNGTLKQTNESVHEARCRLHAEVAGEHNVTAIASNPNGTAMQTWVWNVTEESSFTFECSTGWNMISFPVEPLDNDADTIFGPEYDYLCTWDSDTGCYVPVDVVETEIGYWLLVLADRSVTVLGTQLSEYNTDLAQGWNMIGSLWTATNVPDGTETVPADQMYPYIYGWCGDHYALTPDIDPGLGYWALAYIDCELHVFPAPPAAPLPLPQVLLGDNDWRVKLDVTSGAGTDVAEFGLHEDATDDFSAELDVPEPPSPPPSSTSPYQQAYFYDPENPVVKKLSTSYIPHHFVVDDEEEYNSWLFRLEYSGDASYVTVKWNAKDINAVPAEYSLIFIADGEQIDMRTTPSYTFRAKTRTYEFEIRAITGGKKPDLVIEEEYEKGKAGSYTVFFVVKNIGTATAPGGHYATLYVDGVEKDKKLVPTDLEPGETYESSFKTKVELTGKVENIKVCADSYNDVDELDETNNCLKGRWQPVAEKPTTDKPPTDKPPKEKGAGLGD